MKRKIKLAFSDFWGGFEYNPTGKENFDNVFYRILSERFDVEMSNSPDFLIFSVFGQNHLNYRCRKIFYTGENIRPDFSKCDYSISFDYLNDDRNLRFPLSAITLYEGGIREDFIPVDINLVRKEKAKFCNFIFSNPNAQLRNYLFSELSKYKRVDSGGRVLNNIGYLVDDKLKFISQYKFTISFENSEYPGYTTEKLAHPMLVNSIPIYWGNPLVNKDWNTKSFINAYDFKKISDLIEFIKFIDNNDGEYHRMLNESRFHLPKSKDLDYNTLLDFFEKLI